MTYYTSVSDAIDSTVQITCNPQSGSNFRVGTTNVTCTASDSSSNTATRTFNVTINAYVPPDTDGDGYPDSTDQCPTQYSTTNEGCPEPIVSPVINGTDIELYGGTIYEYEYGVAGGSQRFGSGTMTIGAIKNGQDGFVTAQHVITTPVNIVPTYQLLRLPGDELPFANVTEHYHNRNSIHEKSADAVFIQFNDGYTSPTNQIKDHNDDTISIINKGGLHLQPGTQINLINSTHTLTGMLENFDVTVRDDVRRVNHHQIMGHWVSSTGNSGSPIVTIPENGEATLVGVHVGKLCQYLSVNLFFQEWVPGGIGCGDTSVKILSPWENVVEELGIK